MTDTALWAADSRFGRPLRVGEWLYPGNVALAVRLFRSDTLYGSGDEDDDLLYSEDQPVECYYMQFQAAGEDRWGAERAFRSLDEIERFGREELGGSLRWRE